MSRIDENGDLWLEIMIIAFGGLVGGALGAFSAVTTGGNVLESSIQGIATGVIGSSCGLFLPVATGIFVSAVGGFVVDYLTQSISNELNENKTEEIDLNRSLKTALTTSLGIAIPAFGNAGKNVIDSISTIVIWAEGSTLITCMDVIVTNIMRNRQKKRTSVSGYSNYSRKYYYSH